MDGLTRDQAGVIITTTSTDKKCNYLFSDGDPLLEIVDEANYMFKFNIDCLKNWRVSPFKAMWTLGTSSLKEKLGLK